MAFVVSGYLITMRVASIWDTSGIQSRSIGAPTSGKPIGVRQCRLFKLPGFLDGVGGLLPRVRVDQNLGVIPGDPFRINPDIGDGKRRSSDCLRGCGSGMARYAAPAPAVNRPPHSGDASL